MFTMAGGGCGPCTFWQLGTSSMLCTTQPYSAQLAVVSRPSSCRLWCFDCCCRACCMLHTVQPNTVMLKVLLSSRPILHPLVDCYCAEAERSGFACALWWADLTMGASTPCPAFAGQFWGQTRVGRCWHKGVQQHGCTGVCGLCGYQALFWVHTSRLSSRPLFGTLSLPLLDHHM